MRLFSQENQAEADIRPTLLGIVTLLFLLLFFLLATSSGQRLGVMDLRLTSPEALAPLPHTGVLQRVVVHLQGADMLVEFSLQSTDISASSTTQEQHQRTLPARDDKADIAGLQSILQELHEMDPSQQRVEVDPGDAVPVEQLFAVLDAVRGPDASPLFPRLALTGGG